jgi:hypothetical protein
MPVPDIPVKQHLWRFLIQRQTVQSMPVLLHCPQTFGLPSILVPITVSFSGIPYQMSFNFLPATVARFLSLIFNQRHVPPLALALAYARHLGRAPVLKVLRAPRVRPVPKDFSVPVVSVVLPIARLVTRVYLAQVSA